MIAVERVTFDDTLRLYNELEGKDLVFLPHYEPVNAWCLGAFLSETPVGFLSCNVYGDASAVAVAVLPDYRRRGVAKALMRENLRMSRQQGVSFVLWRLHADNAASEALVRSFGGQLVSEEDGWKKYKIDLTGSPSQ